MIKEMDILELRSALDQKVSALTSLEKLLIRFQTTMSSLKSLEEQRIRELQNLTTFVAQFYGKDSLYKDFTEPLVIAFEKERLELQQTVR